MALLARLKPFNERKGHLTRTYMVEGARFFVDRGWYEVTNDFGSKLKLLHQDHYDLDSPLLFDVCTAKEAEELEENERKVVEVKATPRQPAKALTRGETNKLQARVRELTSPESGDLTSADVTTPPAMLDPDPEGKELDDSVAEEGRAVEVGRVAKSSPPPKQRTRRG